MVDFINPLDFETIFVNVLSGTWLIFGAIALLFIVSLAARFKMQNAVTGSCILLFGILFFGETPWVIYMTILIGSIAIWGVIASLVNR